MAAELGWTLLGLKVEFSQAHALTDEIPGLDLDRKRHAAEAR